MRGTSSSTNPQLRAYQSFSTMLSAPNSVNMIMALGSKSFWKSWWAMKPPIRKGTKAGLADVGGILKENFRMRFTSFGEVVRSILKILFIMSTLARYARVWGRGGSAFGLGKGRGIKALDDITQMKTFIPRGGGAKMSLEELIFAIKDPSSVPYLGHYTGAIINATRDKANEYLKEKPAEGLALLAKEVGEPKGKKYVIAYDASNETLYRFDGKGRKLSAKSGGAELKRAFEKAKGNACVIHMDEKGNMRRKTKKDGTADFGWLAKQHAIQREYNEARMKLLGYVHAATMVSMSDDEQAAVKRFLSGINNDLSQAGNMKEKIAEWASMLKEGKFKYENLKDHEQTFFQLIVGTDNEKEINKLVGNGKAFKILDLTNNAITPDNLKRSSLAGVISAEIRSLQIESEVLSHIEAAASKQGGSTMDKEQFEEISNSQSVYLFVAKSNVEQRQVKELLMGYETGGPMDLIKQNIGSSAAEIGNKLESLRKNEKAVAAELKKAKGAEAEQLEIRMAKIQTAITVLENYKKLDLPVGTEKKFDEASDIVFNYLVAKHSVSNSGAEAVFASWKRMDGTQDVERLMASVNDMGKLQEMDVKTLLKSEDLENRLTNATALMQEKTNILSSLMTNITAIDYQQAMGTTGGKMVKGEDGIKVEKLSAEDTAVRAGLDKWKNETEGLVLSAAELMRTQAHGGEEGYDVLAKQAEYNVKKVNYETRYLQLQGVLREGYSDSSIKSFFKDPVKLNATADISKVDFSNAVERTRAYANACNENLNALKSFAESGDYGGTYLDKKMLFNNISMMQDWIHKREEQLSLETVMEYEKMQKEYKQMATAAEAGSLTAAQLESTQKAGERLMLYERELYNAAAIMEKSMDAVRRDESWMYNTSSDSVKRQMYGNLGLMGTSDYLGSQWGAAFANARGTGYYTNAAGFRAAPANAFVDPLLGATGAFAVLEKGVRQETFIKGGNLLEKNIYTAGFEMQRLELADMDLALRPTPDRRMKIETPVFERPVLQTEQMRFYAQNLASPSIKQFGTELAGTLDKYRSTVGPEREIVVTLNVPYEHWDRKEYNENLEQKLIDEAYRGLRTQGIDTEKVRIVASENRYMTFEHLGEAIDENNWKGIRQQFKNRAGKAGVYTENGAVLANDLKNDGFDYSKLTGAKNAEELKSAISEAGSVHKEGIFFSNAPNSAVKSVYDPMRVAKIGTSDMFMKDEKGNYILRDEYLKKNQEKKK